MKVEISPLGTPLTLADLRMTSVGGELRRILFTQRGKMVKEGDRENDLWMGRL